MNPMPKKFNIDICIEPPEKDGRYWKVLVDKMVIALCPSKETALMYFEMGIKANELHDDLTKWYGERLKGLEEAIDKSYTESERKELALSIKEYLTKE